MPRMRSRRELEVECLVKNKWRGGSSKNSYFSETPSMKPKTLDPWTMARVQIPERGYYKQIFSNQFDTSDNPV